MLAFLFNIQDNGRLPLDFRNLEILLADGGAEGRDASPCKISSKSINPLQRYQDCSIFNMAAVRHLGVLKVLIMAALRSKCGHYIFALWFLLFFFFFFYFVA